ncbi:MAG TPA: phosphoribosyltransferase family protein, partial [Coriobacteriia bacterium]|nr:phosphoribosyltransferase family protein [Coriobacteriia bacterium]
CGAPYGSIVCTECWRAEPAFEAGVCAGSLEPPLSRCITLYKDAGERRLGAPLGDLLARATEAWAGWPEAVVAVPATPRALRLRGFDHTAVIAERVARTLGVAVLPALESVGARDQRALGRNARRENVAGGFAVTRGVAPPPRVLLVDDVMTTGATLDAAAAVLLAAGAKAVRVGAVARAW